VREHDRLIRSLTAAETSVQIGHREVEVAQLRYERGLSNNLDVVTAEGNLLGAESRRVSALADLAVARLSLRALLGVLDPRRDAGSATVTSRAEAHIATARARRRFLQFRWVCRQADEAFSRWLPDTTERTLRCALTRQ